MIHSRRILIGSQLILFNYLEINQMEMHWMGHMSEIDKIVILSCSYFSILRDSSMEITSAVNGEQVMSVVLVSQSPHLFNLDLAVRHQP